MGSQNRKYQIENNQQQNRKWRIANSKAVVYARKNGATLVEAYPVDKPARSKDEHMWFGAKSMYDKAGFEEVARRKPHRPVMRIKPA